MPSIVGIFWHCQMNYCCAAEKRSNSLLENLLESPTDLRNDKNPRIPIKTRNTGVLKLFVFHRYNHFNFHLRSHRQILYSKTGSGGFPSEILPVDFVESSEVLNVSQEAGSFYNVRIGDSNAFKNCFDILDCLFGLLLNAAFHQLTGSRIRSHLAGHEQQSTDNHALRKRSVGDSI